MTEINLDLLEVGAVLPRLELEPITRFDLALYCGGSNDHNRIHVDSDSASEAGLGDVIGHGMLSMAYVGRLLTLLVRKDDVRRFSCRFVGFTRVGDVPVLTGTLKEKIDSSEERAAVLELVMCDQEGNTKVTAEAEVALDNR